MKTKINLTDIVVRSTKKLDAAVRDTIVQHEEYNSVLSGRKYRANFYWRMLERRGAAEFAAHNVRRNAMPHYRKDLVGFLRSVSVAEAEQRLERMPEAAVIANARCFKKELVALAQANLEAIRTEVGLVEEATQVAA
jgi:hypothetical protein